MSRAFSSTLFFCGGIFTLTAGLISLATPESLPESLSREVQSSSTPSKKPSRQLELGDVTEKSKKTKSESKLVINDPAIVKSWGVSKSEAMKAWELSQGDRKIIVAVIDTGIDVDHDDLKKNLWQNEGEVGLDSRGRSKANNGLDDDKNGCVDDVHGCDFITNSGNLIDRHGHGTHIAGIIGAEAGNGIGIAGISPQVSLMILKYYDPKHPNTNTVLNTVNAIRYAVKHGARIINYSGGGIEYSQEEKNAVAEAEKAGVLFVAAAGNEKSNSDVSKYYPADYGLSNIISVTAIDPQTEVLSSSNYGIETVDLAAPGQNILSTIPGNEYGLMTGTSQATAFVTGAAVLIMARRPQFEAADIKKYILNTGSSNSALIAKTRTSKVLNLFKALTMLDTRVAANGLISANESFESFGANSEVGVGRSTSSLESRASLGSMAAFGAELQDRLSRQATVQEN